MTSAFSKYRESLVGDPRIHGKCSRVTEIYKTPVQGLQIKKAPDFDEIYVKLFLLMIA